MPEYSPVLDLRRSRFSPRPAPTLLTAVAVALFASLGLWQLGRAEQKRSLAADFAGGGPAIEWRQLPPDAPRYQRVQVRGHYDPAHQFLLDNMSHESVAGLQVLTPLLLDDGSAVLVNRGWVPWGRNARRAAGGRRGRRAAHDRRPHSTSCRSRASGSRRRPPRVGRGSYSTRAWKNSRRISAASSRSARCCSIPPCRTATSATGSCRAPAATAISGYAVQWFAFAAVAAAIWLVLSFRKPGDSA